MEEENVQVVLRLRPVNEKERKQGEENVWKVYEGASVVLRPEVEDHMPTRKYTQAQMAFNFDRCFGPTTTNEAVFDATVRGMVDSAVNGINATVFMYGQTGSGKTFTMLGYDQKKGIYNKSLAGPREVSRSKSQSRLKDRAPEYSFEQRMKHHVACEEAMTDTQLENKTGLLIQALKTLFEKIKSSEEKTFFVKCSYVEIYNDQIYDLLQRAENIGETLQVCEDTLKDQFFVRGVREEAIDDWYDALDKLKRGEINRHYARTIMNHSSSRSHTIFRVYIQSLVSSWNSKGEAGASPAYVTESWFNFVDLAGSEKVSNHDQLEESIKAEMRVKEGKHINKSLFFLTQVIKLKSEGKKTHIPFRNSPLTKILRSSLGGNSRTAVVLCVNPIYSHLEQTLSTIRFGLSAKKIQNKISANVITRNDDEAVKIMIADYEKKLRDNEKDREVLREREKKLLKQISSMKKKTVDWAKKMKATQNLKFIDIAASVPETNFENLIMDYDKYNLAHMGDVGLINFPRNRSSKYSEFCSHLRSKVIETFNKENGVFGDFDHECLNKAYHTPAGEYAMLVLERLKSTADFDLILYNKIADNWNKLGLEANFVYLVEQLQALSQLARNNIGKVEQLASLCEEEAQASKQQIKRIEVLEGKLNLSALSDDAFDKLAGRVETYAARVAAERKRRETAASIVKAASEVNMPEDLITSLVQALPKDSFVPESNEEAIALEDAQAAYLERLSLQCKHDSVAVTEFESLEGPSQQEMTELVFKDCDKLLARRHQLQSEHSEHWQVYLQKTDEHRQAMKQLYAEKIQNGDALQNKGAKQQESLKGVWLDVDQILEETRAANNKEDAENMSVSQMSASQGSQTHPNKPETNADSEGEMEKDSESASNFDPRQRRDDSLERPQPQSRSFLDEDNDTETVEYDIGFEIEGNEEEERRSNSDSDREKPKEMPMSINLGKMDKKATHTVSSPRFGVPKLALVDQGKSQSELEKAKKKGVHLKQLPSESFSGVQLKQTGQVSGVDSKSNQQKQRHHVDRPSQSPRPLKPDIYSSIPNMRDAEEKPSKSRDLHRSNSGLQSSKQSPNRSVSKKAGQGRDKSPTFGDVRRSQGEKSTKVESIQTISGKPYKLPLISQGNKPSEEEDLESLAESIFSVSTKNREPVKVVDDDLDISGMLKAKAMDLKSKYRRGRAHRTNKKDEDDE